MKVFVTGATGYIGGAVVDALLGFGHAVSGLARSDDAETRLASRGVWVCRGDLYDGDALRRAALEADAVIHTAIVRGPEAAKADRCAVDALLDQLVGTGKPFVYTSGAFVYGDTGDGIADEETPVNPPPFFAARTAIERDVRAAASRGIRVIVIRPPTVYGRGGSFIVPRLLADARRSGAGRYIGSGDNWWSTVHVDDLADLYVKALERAGAGTVLNAAVEPFLTTRAIAEAVSLAAGCGGKVAPWPVDEASQVFGPYAAGMALNQRISGAKARELLGWQPRQPSLLTDLEHGSYTERGV